MDPRCKRLQLLDEPQWLLPYIDVQKDLFQRHNVCHLFIQHSQDMNAKKEQAQNSNLIQDCVNHRQRKELLE